MSSAILLVLFPHARLREAQVMLERNRRSGRKPPRRSAAILMPRPLALAADVQSQSDESAGTLASAAYRRLRDDILTGALLPNEKLPMRELQLRYRIGLAPLREALARLTAENLVFSSDHRGYWVAPISVDELRDLTRVRMLLESEALRGSIAQGDDAWEAEVVSTFHRLALVTERGAHLADETLPEWEARHEDFHRALISSAGSRLLLRLRAILAQLVRRYRLYAVAAGVNRDHLGEHRAIKEAALARDADRAAQLLSMHYELTTRTILAKFAAGES